MFACQLKKAHKLSFNHFTSMTTEPLELIFLFVPIKQKSDALLIFKQFKVYVELQFNKKIKTLQTDWGGEYRSFTNFLATFGVKHSHPCPHTHEQQGNVERKHRHIVEMGLTLLARASMP